MTKTRPLARRAGVAAGAVLVLFLVLALPGPAPTPTPEGAGTAFRWDADELFAELEARFEAASVGDPVRRLEDAERLTSEGRMLLDSMAGATVPPLEDLGRIATMQFELAVLGAADPALLQTVSAWVVEVREAVMEAATRWPVDRPTHESLYRIVFGGRIALDEALVQAGLEALPALRHFEDVPSETPFLEVEGVRIHSGDILLSRGGAPTSALIARGNDFPNTFSHAALAHVDSETGQGVVIESLIEAGAVLTTVDEYLESKKHRILVLRLRADHPALVADPLLPHRAAELALERVTSGHIPYDFAMDWGDPSEAFCSEIIYHPYRESGVDLWTIRSAMSAPGLVAWLSAMGVREFTTLVPSDVEYDPQLSAVAEWRDAPALMEYRIDNAITDSLLEEAERGARLSYPWYALPPARLLKAYSALESALGGMPTIPAGMSASTALRVDALVSRIHPPLATDVRARADRYRLDNGREAPYWALVDLARTALEAQRTALEPALRPG